MSIASVAATASANSGLLAASAAFQRSADDVLRAANPDAGKAAAEPELAQAVTGLKKAETEMKANVMVARAEDDMTGALLDMKA